MLPAYVLKVAQRESKWWTRRSTKSSAGEGMGESEIMSQSIQDAYHNRYVPQPQILRGTATKAQ